MSSWVRGDPIDPEDEKRAGQIIGRWAAQLRDQLPADELSSDMWILVLGFGAATLLLAWLLFGYVIWLRFVSDARRRPALDRPASFPFISVIVPCLNEEDLIREKYLNLMGCEYPADRLEVVFADGGSTDRTLSILESLGQDDEQARVIPCPSGGKINQLNHVLPLLKGDIVVVTDADARLASDALVYLAAEFEADPGTAVVGAFTSPHQGLAIERCYWAAQNRVRLLESRLLHVSTLAACCYAFRRGFLEAFPEDVVADDVYTAVLANTFGHQVIYSAKVRVVELRTPESLPEFFAHKFRKGNAVLRETLRFVYRLPEMVPQWRVILGTRVLQQFLLPWGSAFWIVLAIILANLGQADVVFLGAAMLVAALLITRKATTAVELPDGNERFSFWTIGLAYVYTLAVLTATALSYPFFRQTSCYARLATARKGDRGDRSHWWAAKRRRDDDAEAHGEPASGQGLHRVLGGVA